MYYQIFTATFIVTAIIYSILAATTKVFYKNKDVFKLSSVEIDILNDKANFLSRVGVFFMNFMSSLISPPVWIIAGLITLIAYLINLVI